MSTKSAGIGNIGEEELTRLRMGRQSLGDVEATLKVLMGDEAIAKMKGADLKKIQDLFVMSGTNITQAPNLTKEAMAKNVTAFFEKISSAHLSEAQKRYPELLKVSSSASVASPSSTTSSTPTPDLKTKMTGPVGNQAKIPTRSMMAGGSA
jgi:hypothetical protein